MAKSGEKYGSNPLQETFKDLTSPQAYRVALILGWQDVRQAYRRSALGAWWITAGMAIQISTMGVVFGLIFKSPLSEYLPFLATSIVLWTFIALILNETSLSFIQGEGIIKQMKFPMAMHVARVIWKNLLSLGHNALILPIVFIICGSGLSWVILLFVPGFFLLMLNLGWLSLFLATATSRFRDLLPITNSVTSILLYITPVMWFPALIPDGIPKILMSLNPFYHLIQISRQPLLGELPTSENWVVSIAIAVVGWTLAIFVFSRSRKQIAYWI